MRFITMLLALFFAFLVTMPCTDGSDHANETAHTHCKAHNHSSDEHVDTCSPFCSCACCGIHLMVADYSIYHFKTNVSPTYAEIVTYQPQNELGIVHGIWQPPKI
ncbi:hypothetical protein H1R17_07250 [Flavobacterium sp. xlx-214]|uniref:DUF6660 family protein n=1 Tax=unclassified Flavobacterium TaxID=196869 RepID=UPI0013D68D93|nr:MULTISPECIES: DUF6660 family protein [unclassified Flavobacterium]MBA5792545.1 hypothetical protein [Flavobacterium sp. xlx-221]QMI82305.1 hypothetical protein H1R17_07250 [Flavobacterium sp. xlx-214]